MILSTFFLSKVFLYFCEIIYTLLQFGTPYNKYAQANSTTQYVLHSPYLATSVFLFGHWFSSTALAIFLLSSSVSSCARRKRILSSAPVSSDSLRRRRGARTRAKSPRSDSTTMIMIINKQLADFTAFLCCAAAAFTLVFPGLEIALTDHSRTLTRPSR